MLWLVLRMFGFETIHSAEFSDPFWFCTERITSFIHLSPKQVIPPGRAAWVREEALASILSVVMLELPVSKVQAQLFQDQNGGEKKNQNVAAAFINRISLQVREICKEWSVRLILNGHRYVRLHSSSFSFLPPGRTVRLLHVLPARQVPRSPSAS